MACLQNEIAQKVATSRNIVQQVTQNVLEAFKSSFWQNLQFQNFSWHFPKRFVRQFKHKLQILSQQESAGMATLNYSHGNLRTDSDILV